MAGCITEDFREVILGLIDEDTDKAVLKAVVGVIPACTPAMIKEKRRPGVEVAAWGTAAHRALAAPWGIEPVYVDKSGERTSYPSLSGLLKELNLPLSGTQCDVEGKKCRAQSVVEIFQIHGYTVSGNGEPKKKGEGGTKLTIFHPESPQMKEATS